MLPYKTRRTTYAVFTGLLGLGFFWLGGWNWIKDSRELGVGDMALGVAQLVVACIIWKRRNREPPPRG